MRSLTEIEDFHHRGDYLGYQDSCRCGQKMPCDALVLFKEIWALKKDLLELVEAHALDCAEPHP